MNYKDNQNNWIGLKRKEFVNNLNYHDSKCAVALAGSGMCGCQVKDIWHWIVSALEEADQIGYARGKEEGKKDISGEVLSLVDSSKWFIEEDDHVGPIKETRVIAVDDVLNLLKLFNQPLETKNDR